MLKTPWYPLISSDHAPALGDTGILRCLETLGREDFELEEVWQQLNSCVYLLAGVVLI